MSYVDRRDKDFSKYLHRAKKKKFFLLQKILKQIANPTLFLLGVRVFSRENLPEKPYILAPAHSDLLDPILVSFASRQDPVRFMGKSQIFRIPFIHIFIALGAFPVRRKSNDQESLNTALELLKKGQHLVIFPQGTRIANPEIHQAKWGAGLIFNKSGAPVIPVWIKKRENGWGLKRDVYFGQLIYFDKCSQPSREDNLAASQKALQEIIALKEKYQSSEQKGPRNTLY